MKMKVVFCIIADVNVKKIVVLCGKMFERNLKNTLPNFTSKSNGTATDQQLESFLHLASVVVYDDN